MIRQRQTIHEVAADPDVQRALARIPRAAPPLHADPSVQKALYLVPRGESPRAIASSRTRRREFADPATRKEILARLRTSRTESSYLRPRDAAGKWIAAPSSEMARRRRSDHARRHRNIATASRARFADPAFRARVLEQLALAREAEMERRRLKRDRP